MGGTSFESLTLTMLSRISAAARLPALRATGARGFAVRAPPAKNTGPSLLSIRLDSLVFGCVVAALIHFVPQDAIFCGCLLWYWHAKAKAISPVHPAHDGE